MAIPDVTPRTWIVELAEVYGGLATFSSDKHLTTFTLSTEDWIERGRPSKLFISPRTEP